MTPALASLADIAYRRRGRVILTWIGAMIVLIGLGSSFAGDYTNDYATPNSDSKAATDLTEREFGGYSGHEIEVVWQAESGADSPEAKAAVRHFLAEAKQVDHVAEETPIRISEGGAVGVTTLPLTVPGWEVDTDAGEQLVAAAEEHSGDGVEIKLGGDSISRAQEGTSPERIGFVGAAIVLLIAFGSVVAAGLPLAMALVGLGISSGGLIVLLAHLVEIPDWPRARSARRGGSSGYIADNLAFGPPPLRRRGGRT